MKKINLTFYVKKDKINPLGQVPIYTRIITEGTKTTFSTLQWIDEKRWKETKQLKLARIPADVIIRDELNRIRIQINSKGKEMINSEVELTAENLKNVFLGKETFAKANSKTYMEAFDYHNLKFVEKIKRGEGAKASLTKFKSTQTHLKSFIQAKYGANDIALDELNFEFIDGFDMFLRTEKEIKNNTTVKYCQAAKKVTNLAIKYDWLSKDPFAKYEGKLIVEDAVYLTQEELEKIENKVFSTERLNTIKDIFLFSCYTGYAPCDVAKLTWNNVQTYIDGELWIIAKRKKTKTDSNVPLLPEAKKLIEKYKNHPDCIVNGSLFPKKSNQKVNEYLKEIADLCGIDKTLHHYVARHTFATTVTLANGVSLEAVSKMMGHLRITQTQHYAKIRDNIVSQEMLKLKERMEQKEKPQTLVLPINSAIAG